MKWKTKYILCLIPSLTGILIFYIIPFIKVLYYSLIDSQFNKVFVGFKNYWNVLNNKYFMLAVKNSFLIIIVCVPIVVILSIILSLVLSKANSIIKILSSFFIIPMIIPTASIISVWQNWFNSMDSAVPIYLLFIWKNIGICIILISASISTIPIQLYEAAELDGAESFKKHIYITIPCTFPSILFSVLITIVNSFKIYKESYLYYSSNYPPEHSYTLQYYMNNNFLKLDYQTLSSAAVLNLMLILLIVLAMLKVQRKYS